MEFELWYLAAVPLLFGAGWFLRGLDSKQRSMETQGLDDNYFAGLSLLLANEPDKAIDRFIEVVRLDPETIELHHALGNLFRRRGEFDRAIRIHSYLTNRAELSDKERSLALSELALDFLKAGIYDNAEEAYQLLSKIPERRVEALSALMRIYCTEREWQKAVEAAEQLSRESGRDLTADMAHFYCELSEIARGSNDAERAREFALRAAALNPVSVRALSILADLAMGAGKTEEAFQYWEKIETDAPRFVPLIASKKADVLAATDKKAAAAYLKKVFEQTGSTDVLSAAVKKIAVWLSPEESLSFATEAVRRSATLSAFAVYCNVRKTLSPENEEAKLLSDITQKQAKKLGRYQCRCCGFLAHTFAWQCPGCEKWDAFPPVRVEEGKREG